MLLKKVTMSSTATTFYINITKYFPHIAYILLEGVRTSMLPPNNPMQTGTSLSLTGNAPAWDLQDLRPGPHGGHRRLSEPDNGRSLLEPQFYICKWGKCTPNLKDFCETKTK